MAVAHWVSSAWLIEVGLRHQDQRLYGDQHLYRTRSRGIPILSSLASKTATSSHSNIVGHWEQRLRNSGGVTTEFLFHENHSALQVGSIITGPNVAQNASATHFCLARCLAMRGKPCHCCTGSDWSKQYLCLPEATWLSIMLNLYLTCEGQSSRPVFLSHHVRSLHYVRLSVQRAAFGPQNLTSYLK